MVGVELVSPNTELKKWLKSDWQSRANILTYGTLKDGLRSLSKNKVDLLIVDVSNARILKGTWLKHLSAQKDLAGGELSVLLLAPSVYQQNADLHKLAKRFHVEDIFWYNEHRQEPHQALNLFIERNIKALRFKRAAHLLAHENQALTGALKAGQPKKPVPAVPGEPWSFLITKSSAAVENMKRANQAAAQERPVLLLCPPGEEKEQLAQYIHLVRHSDKKPFISIDLRKIAGHLQEARLFGFKKDTIPSQLGSGRGALEQAADGTLHLSAIDELSWEIQAKLLRALEEQEFSRLGERKRLKVKCSLVFDSSVALEKKVDQGLFRQDLFYHIKFFPIHLPQLNQRRADIPLIVDDFCLWYNRQFKTTFELDNSLKMKLANRSWPGGTGQLYGFLSDLLAFTNKQKKLSIETLAIFEKKRSSQLEKKELESIPGQLFLRENNSIAQPGLFSPGFIEPTIQELERQYIKQVLANHNHNYSKAARILGITRKTLYDKIRKYSLPPRTKKA